MRLIQLNVTGPLNVCCCICGEELMCNDAGEMPSLCPNCGVMVEYPTPCIEMEGV